MSAEVAVPDAGTLRLVDGVPGSPPGAPHRLPRRCFAASRVVVRDDYASAPHAPDRPGTPEEILGAIDWDATVAQRARLDGLGFGIAEAMDTSQRFELGWTVARELIDRTAELGPKNGFVAGAASDHLAGKDAARTVDELADAVAFQVDHIAGRGGIPIVLPQLWLTANGATEDDYLRFYLRVADASPVPVLLHWLGEVFHPAMRGYFPGQSARRILAERPDKVRGIKLSLLDPAFEVELRNELRPRGQLLLTGDDWNFSALIEGDASSAPDGEASLGDSTVPVGPFSHALLGVLDAIGAPASHALTLLGQGDVEGYRARMNACERLGRVLFEAPTGDYKAGLAFVAWLNGLQSNPMLPNHVERSRSLEHYLRVAALASDAGALLDAELAAARLRELIAALS